METNEDPPSWQELEIEEALDPLFCDLHPGVVVTVLDCVVCVSQGRHLPVPDLF